MGCLPIPIQRQNSGGCVDLVSKLFRLVLRPCSIRTGWHEHAQQRALTSPEFLTSATPHARAALLADVQLPVYLIAARNMEDERLFSKNVPQFH